jgi:CheY-like chemotaxis protein
MPVINGYDATREIKKIRPSLPIIAQTAFATQDEMIKCQQSGCDEIITKPIDIKLLFKKITDLLH